MFKWGTFVRRLDLLIFPMQPLSTKDLKRGFVTSTQRGQVMSRTKRFESGKSANHGTRVDASLLAFAPTKLSDRTNILF